MREESRSCGLYPGEVQIAADPIPPLLRGWLHLVCFFLAIPAGAVVVLQATTTRERIGAIVYATAMIALFGVSGAYHRGRWSPAARLRMKRLDHATIFVMIAGSYTPLCLLALRGTTGTVLLITAWAGAAAGFALALLGIAERRILGLVGYIALGWAAVLGLPGLANGLSTRDLSLVIVGGVLYTSGAVMLGLKWPLPRARIFGYHEVWHVMVLAGVICHFIPIVTVVGGGAS
jgi:hemolysin III